MTDRQIALCRMVDRHKDAILFAERHIAAQPEPGFQEWKTTAYLKKEFESLGYTLQGPDNIPGFFTDIETGRPGPKVLVLGELDALLCAGHPEENAGVAHACGHNAQCAALLGLAAALKEEGALNGLSGSIRLMAVPAEEMIQLDYRNQLRREGKIRYLDGKVEFMSRGYMDDVDLAFMVHTGADDSCDFYCNQGHNGFLVKRAEYLGKAAHAGASPELGINAMYAAGVGLDAINALRETFRDEDHIRVHPILTEAGTSVNSIPERAVIENYVRGASLCAIDDVSQRVNRALAGAAVALGTGLIVSNQPGYAPMHNDPALMQAAKACMEALVGPDRVNFRSYWSRGSTDMGDLSAVIPAIHPYACGAEGAAHAVSWRVKDPERACVNSAKAQLLLLAHLLENDASCARNICHSYVPVYPDIPSYLRSIDERFAKWQLSCASEADGSMHFDWQKQ